jgi:phenylalanyl-tRNA synthetase alpha chain
MRRMYCVPHTTAQIPGILRELAATEEDWYDVVILLPGFAYGRDVTDKKHVGQVHMLEMWRIVRTKKVKSIAKDDLLAIVKGITAIAAPGWKLRIIDSIHPYAKQGIEVNAVLGDRDIEILECGLISDRLLASTGLDPKEYSGWALGMGLDRLVMTLKDIPDIRYLRSTNPNIAMQVKDLSRYHEVSSRLSHATCRTAYLLVMLKKTSMKTFVKH